MPEPTRVAPRSPAGRLLLPCLALLLVVDLVGGLWAVAAGVNTWAEAWGSKALMAAPAPMIAVQVLLAWLAARGRPRVALVAGSLLSTACLVSVASGFFDGGLGNDALTPAMGGFQALLLAVTFAVGVLAAGQAHRAYVVGRSRSSRSPSAHQASAEVTATRSMP